MPEKPVEPEKLSWFVWGTGDYLTYYDTVKAATAEEAAEGLARHERVTLVRVWPLRDDDEVTFDVEHSAEMTMRERA